jgi:hypothetical protein
LYSALEQVAVVTAATCSNALYNFQHITTVTHTYGCTLQCVLLMITCRASVV